MSTIFGVRTAQDPTARMNFPPHLPSSGHPVAIPRAQVGIEPLPTRRGGNQPRELMNCKSCRKRKIKCNRLRPACEACQVFQCPCIYDATPKKRGPKGDVLEALLRRVDGLEAKLKDKSADEVSPPFTDVSDERPTQTAGSSNDNKEGPAMGLGLRADTSTQEGGSSEPFLATATDNESTQDPVQTETLLDTYFKRIHAKPYHILDESSVRQRFQLGLLPKYIQDAVCAVAARHTPHPEGYQAAVQLSNEFAAAARKGLNTDEPSIDCLQASLLLVLAFTAAGKGRKAYMLMSYAIGIATALELHRETDSQTRVTPVERELRRRLFWTCYLLDRFNACGSRRPSLISDQSIALRLPCWSPNPSSLPMEGDFFQAKPNQRHSLGAGSGTRGVNGMLINITRILGTTNRYLAVGGVKGDSHFPWHALSKLSIIRQDLEAWAAQAEDTFRDSNSLFTQVDSPVLVLARLIYHLIHCLLYRSFLPIDLSELSLSAQHQSWQIEATNLCFMHADAISELINTGQGSGMVEWPSFVGYCICTAATVHIHGAYYHKKGDVVEMNAFGSASEFLSREMQQLSELRYAWAGVQHQRETLQAIYNAHAELVQDFASNPNRTRPGLQPGDFFDRYLDIGGPGGRSYVFDTANLSLSDVEVDMAVDAYHGNDLFAPRPDDGPGRPNLKRKSTAPPSVGEPNISRLKIDQTQEAAVKADGTTRQRQHSAAASTILGAAQHLASPVFAPSPSTQRTPMSAGGFEHYRPRLGPNFEATSGSMGDQAFSGSAPGWRDDRDVASKGSGRSLAQRGSDREQGGHHDGTSAAGQSISQVQSEEKDPFMSFLEELAETGGHMDPVGRGHLDFMSGFTGNA